MKKAIALILSLIMVMSSCMCMASALFEKKEAILRLIVPENWEMDIGDSRTVDCAVKNTSNYVKWTAEPADVAKVDAYGRVTALKEGTAEITAPGKILQFFPICAPSKIVTFDPMRVPSSITTFLSMVTKGSITTLSAT